MIFRRSCAMLFLGMLLLPACQSAPVPTALPAATASPSAQPTSSPPAATATLAPAARDFTEAFDSLSADWSLFGTRGPLPDIQMQDGFLVFNLARSVNWAYAVYSPQEYQDVRVDAQVEVRAGKDGAVGIVCRYGPSTGWYEFNVYADQTYTLLYGQWLSPGVARYTPMRQTTSEKIKAGANQIGLLCQGDQLTPYINTVRMQVYSATRFELKGGQIGLTAASFTDAPFIAAYNWVSVSER